MKGDITVAIQTSSSNQTLISISLRGGEVINEGSPESGGLAQIQVAVNTQVSFDLGEVRFLLNRF